MSNFLCSIRGLYASDPAPRRHKMCANCGTQYSDVSKANSNSCCLKKCTHELMVFTRHENGSYVRTEIQNDRLSATLIRRNKEDPTINERRSVSLLKTHKENPELGEAARLLILKRFDEGWSPKIPIGDDHWTRTDPTAHVRLSAARIGKKPSLETRKLQSIAAQKRVKDCRVFSRGKGGVRTDLNQYFRSKWEANFARVLNLQGKEWMYEKFSFQLTDTMSYTPDFLVEEEGTLLFYEVKGWWTEHAKEVFTFFRKLHPEIPIIVVDAKVYKELRKQYKELISWEA